MTTKTELETSLKDAMRAGDDVRKRTLRMALSAIKQAEIDKNQVLDETGIAAILQKEINPAANLSLMPSALTDPK